MVDAMTMRIPDYPESAKLMSPNQLVKAARDEMLDGAEIKTFSDQVKIVSFLAVNIQRDMARDGTFLVTRLYPELASLTREEVELIVFIQMMVLDGLVSKDELEATFIVE